MGLEKHTKNEFKGINVTLHFLISFLNLGFTKLLVVGGQNYPNCTDVTEIIDKTCENLHNFPYAVMMPTGGLLSNGSPVICSGAWNCSTPVNECFSYYKNSVVNLLSRD